MLRFVQKSLCSIKYKKMQSFKLPILIICIYPLFGGISHKSNNSKLNVVNGSVEKDKSQIVDSRDGKKYQYLQIGNLFWLKENLKYQTPKSECYEGKDTNCEKYGRLYSYKDSKNACPEGWHLPSRKEWRSLRKVMGSRKANKIIAIDEWEGKDYRGATNELGLNILPGGRKDENGAFTRESTFGEKGISTSYWLNDFKYHWHIRWGKSHIHKHGDVRTQGRKFYIRCVCELEKLGSL